MDMTEYKPTLRESLFFKWLLSYISILLVPLVISGVIYNFAVNIIRNETNRANSALLIQLQKNIDNILGEIEQAGFEIAFNKQVSRAISVKGDFKASDQYNLKKTIEELKVCCSTKNVVDGIFLYCKNSNSVISDKMKTDIVSFYEFNKNDIIVDFDTWNELLQKPHNKEYILLENSPGMLGAKRNIAYLQSLPVFNPSLNTAIMIIIMYEDKLLQIMEDVQWVNKGAVIIVDNNNNMIASTKPVGLSDELTYDSLEKEQDIINISIDGEENVVSYVSSKINDWKFILLMPNSVFWEKVEYVRALILFSIALCIIVGGIIAYVFAKRNYNPIQKLIQALTKRDILSFESKHKEYSYIWKTVNDVLDEKNTMARALKIKEDVLRNNYLIRLLESNNVPASYIDPIFASYGIDPATSYFSVLTFHIKPFRHCIPGENRGDTQESMELDHFIVSNVVSEMIKRKYTGLMVDMGDKLTCIVRHKNTVKSDFSSDICRIAKEARQFIANNFDISFTVSAGNAHMGLNGIRKSYKEALEAFDVKMFSDGEDIILYDDTSSLALYYHYSNNVENRLVNMIRTGNYDRAWSLLEEVFKKSYENGPCPVKILKYMVFDIASTFIKLLSISGDEKYAEGIEPFLERLMECTSISQMEKEVGLMLRMVCDSIKAGENGAKRDLCAKVIEYINDNYQNYDLNVNMIAEHFKITPSYLSRVFRKNTNEKLTDAINRIRVKKSMELLKNEELSVKRVSEIVGYLSSNVFIKNFKKIEGITPGEFRSAN